MPSRFVIWAATPQVSGGSAPGRRGRHAVPSQVLREREQGPPRPADGDPVAFDAVHLRPTPVSREARAAGVMLGRTVCPASV